MQQYADIIFLQGDEADEFLNVLHEHGETEVIERLKDWDSGEHYDIREERGGGTNDSSSTHGEYVLTYNTALSYIGLEKIIEIN